MFNNYLPTRLVKTNQNVVPAPSNTTADVKTPDTCGRTPLHRACWDGDEVKVKELVTDANSAILNAKDQWGRTPLWCAVTQGQLGTVRIMVENIDVHLKLGFSFLQQNCENLFSWSHQLIIKHYYFVLQAKTTI